MAPCSWLRRSLRACRARGQRLLLPPTGITGIKLWRDTAARESPRPRRRTQGAAVSPGRVTPEACVILSPAEFGKTILLCPTTTPAWTQLFPVARGLVTDVGGVLAHGSIVCREYGIPGVLWVGDATSQIADRASVTVDSDRGAVTLGEVPALGPVTTRVTP